jgi:hypothetical protein
MLEREIAIEKKTGHLKAAVYKEGELLKDLS